MKSVIQIGKGILTLLLGGILGWRILVSGIADYYAQQEQPEAADGALRWREQHPEALYQKADTLLDQEPATAERLLQEAIWANPTDARAYAALSEIRTTQGRESANKLMELADMLGPVNSPVLARSADFWQAQGRLDRMLAHWSRLLQAHLTTVASAFYPVLLGFAEDPNQRDLLLPLLKDPPTWWTNFFVYAAREAQLTDTVVFLYQNRQRETTPLSEGKHKKDKKEKQDEKNQQNEEDVYLDRLWKDARWTEAREAWQNGLNDRQRNELGNLYNGGFELPITNVGFDWNTLSLSRGAIVETAATYGVHGERALHVVFDGQRVKFQHILQYLMLEPKHYQLQGRARPDNLRAVRGLRWRLYCIPFGKPDEASFLAESARFVGSDEWRTFTVDFTVPAKSCAAQMLRLELEGRARLDFEVQGCIWFDDLSINQAEEEKE